MCDVHETKAVVEGAERILCPTTTSAAPLSRHIFDFEPSTKPLATKFKTGHPGSIST
jgi:hypothetical protein